VPVYNSKLRRFRKERVRLGDEDSGTSIRFRLLRGVRARSWRRREVWGNREGGDCTGKRLFPKLTETALKDHLKTQTVSLLQVTIKGRAKGDKKRR